MITKIRVPRLWRCPVVGCDHTESIPVGTSIIDQIGIALLHIGAAHPDCDILAGLVDRIGGEQS